MIESGGRVDAQDDRRAMLGFRATIPEMVYALCQHAPCVFWCARRDGVVSQRSLQRTSTQLREPSALPCKRVCVSTL